MPSPSLPTRNDPAHAAETGHRLRLFDRAQAAKRRKLPLDGVLSFVFVLAIAAPGVVQQLRAGRGREALGENRFTADAPRLEASLESWSSYPARFEAWFGDTLGFRKQLLRWHNALDLFVFHVSPSETLVKGADDWYFWGDELVVDEHRGLHPFSPHELEAWRKALTSRSEWLARRGIHYVFAVAPQKEQVYPEHFPERFNRVGRTRMDELARALADHADFAFVDLREALIAEKAFDRPDDYVYHRLGTHWTARGAFAGCRALLGALIDAHPTLRLPQREEFESRVLPDAPQDSMGIALYLHDLLWESIHGFERRAPARAVRRALSADTPPGVITFETGDDTLPRVVLLHDSFGPWLWPFLAEQCSRLVCVMNTAVATTVISIERPDVVIQMRTERVLSFRRAPWLLAGEIVDRSLFESAEPTAPPAKGSIPFGVGGPDSVARLPAVSIPPLRRAVMRAQIESHGLAVLTLEVAHEAQAGVRSPDRFCILLEAGRNDLYFVLPGSAAPDGWIVTAESGDGPVAVHEYEIRTYVRE